MTDLELLRRHEPIVRFTSGELFFPCATDEYVKDCSLWMRVGDGQSQALVQRGELDLGRLAAEGENANGHSLYLRFVEQPLSPREFQQWLRRPGRIRFHAPGRLARVPPWSRLLDSAFELSLLVRGRVPGGTAAAAQIKYTKLLNRDNRRVYYARVVRDGDWTVLHYLFFYVMNDWRSEFHGANDHEADWEQMFVYLCKSKTGALEPCWVAYASHDEYGDNLRRRWDDPLLTREGTHPVVFAAAGSHSSYFEQGEYVMRVEPAFLQPLKRLAISLRRIWVQRLKQGYSATVDRTITALVSIPFVDYARGDGECVGPGGHFEWTPILISDEVAWVSRYRGLWGLETSDPFGGERAPAGPKHNRDGSVRRSWYDPLGWVGLDKVVPPPELAPSLLTRKHALAEELAQLDQRIIDSERALQILALDEEALRASDSTSAIHKQAVADLTTAEKELHELKQQRMLIAQTKEALEQYPERVRNGTSGGPHAHLRNVHHPDPSPRPRRVLQIWAALSGAMALLAVGSLIVVFPRQWWFWALVLGFGFGTVEAAAEARLLNFLLKVAIILAVISALILAWEFWRVLVVGALAVAITFMIRDNVRELRRG
jgi:hypothetical protein